MPKTRQPIDIIIAKGKKHLTKAEIEERREQEIQTSADDLKIPAYLPAKLKKRFKELSDQLIQLNILANIDGEALARYITSEEQYQKLSGTLLKKVDIDEEYIKLTNLQEKLFKQSRAAANDLGLNITSRCKIILPKQPEKVAKENKFDKFIK